MRIYVASRFSDKKRVNEIFRKLEKKGHEISHDWTKHHPIKPYSKNAEKSRIYSMQDIDGILNSDVFILLTDESGTGMYIELGAAIILKMMHHKPDIYVVGKHRKEQLFFFHPTVKTFETIEEVIECLE